MTCVAYANEKGHVILVAIPVTTTLVSYHYIKLINFKIRSTVKSVDLIKIERCYDIIPSNNHQTICLVRCIRKFMTIASVVLMFSLANNGLHNPLFSSRRNHYEGYECMTRFLPLFCCFRQMGYQANAVEQLSQLQEFQSLTWFN